jgi:hypothetical protein
LAASAKNKVDRLRRRFFRGTDEIAFVLAILRVNDNHHRAACNRIDGGGNTGKLVGYR